MNLLFAATECAPFFKTGGLGDVLGALPKELARQGHDVRVALPYFSKQLSSEYQDQLTEVARLSVYVGWRKQYAGIYQIKQEGVTYYFIDNPYYFKRAKFYDYADDGERFAFFCQAAIEMIASLDFIPDIFHVNDWHTAMIPVLLKEKYQDNQQLSSIKTVFTIHNIMFQGNFGKELLEEVFGMDGHAYQEEGLRSGDHINYLKGAIYYSDLVTTVSPTYAEEIQTEEFGYGLNKDLQSIQHKLTGIVNGIDYDVYNPETDRTIPHTFSLEDFSGKAKNKAALQERVGLPQDPNVALVGLVTRLDEQKGIQLVVEAMDELVDTCDFQFVVLGTGKPYFEESLEKYTEQYPSQVKAIVDFDIELAQWIYAGSDLFLMPSKFEPCGLSQLNSLRYGTLPIVHKTGGLADTVASYEEASQEGTGFVFETFDAATMVETVKNALNVYYEHPKQWQTMLENAMTKNNSWEKSAQQYLSHYKELIETN
jgi:starch synthase